MKYIYLTGTTLFKNFIAWFILCIGFALSPSISHAEVDYERQQRLYDVINGYQVDIAKRADALVEAIGRARDAGSTDPALWQEVDQKRSDYVQTAKQTLPLIDQMVKNLLDNNPAARIPAIYIRSPFADVLAEAQAEQKEASEFASRFLAAYQFCQNELLQARLDNIEAIRDSMNKFLLTAAGASTTTYAGGRLFAPKLVRFTPLTGLLTAVWGLRGDADVINTIVYRRQVWERLSKEAWDEYQNMKPALEQFEMLVKSLAVWHKESLEIEDSAKKFSQAWQAYLDTAVKNQRSQEEAAYQKQKTSPPPTVNIGSPYLVPPIPPLTPADYMPEVDGYLAEFESEYKAIVDGGDPANLQEVGKRVFGKITDNTKRAKDSYDRAAADLQQAWTDYYKATQPIYEHYNAIMAKGNWCGGCANYPSVKALNEQVIREAQAYLQPALEAALQPVKARAAALVGPIREVNKYAVIYPLVSEAYNKIYRLVYVHIELVSGQFRSLWETHQSLMSAAMSSFYSVWMILPSSYEIESWKMYADTIDSTVSAQLASGMSPAAIQSGLFENAAKIMQRHELLKKVLPDLERAELEVISSGMKAERELTSFYNKNSKTLTFYNPYGYYYSSDDIAAKIKQDFEYRSGDDVKKLKQADLAAIAKRFESKAHELDDMVAWIDFYLGRVSVAAYRLGKICLDATEKELYEIYRTPVRQGLLDEFKGPKWQNLLSIIDSAVPVQDRTGNRWAGIYEWDQRLPRERIDVGLIGFYMRLQELMKDYLRSLTYGGYVLINRAEYEKAVSEWETLKKGITAYNAAVSGLSPEIQQLLAKVKDYREPVTAAYDKMPEYLRKYINDEHKRFTAAANWIETYLQMKESGILPVNAETSTHYAKIEEWLTGYDKMMKEWAERQKKAEEEMERQRRLWEAEQARLKAEEDKRRAAEEEARRQAEEQMKARTAAVMSLYEQFKQAYEERNDSLLISYMGDDWEAGDGTTLSDLQVNFSRTFRTFDEIRYNVQNLKIEQQPDGKFRSYYDVTITSRIYRRNLKHEEKSSVAEEVTVDASGKARISRTLSGRFWYVE